MLTSRLTHDGSKPLWASCLPTDIDNDANDKDVPKSQQKHSTESFCCLNCLARSLRFGFRPLAHAHERCRIDKVFTHVRGYLGFIGGGR